MRVHISAKSCPGWEHFVPNLKFVALIVFELLAFNAEKFRGHVTLATPLLEKFLEVMSRLSLGRLVSNLKSVALIVFELLAFNAEKFSGSRDPGQWPRPFWKNFGSHPDCHWEHLCQIWSP